MKHNTLRNSILGLAAVCGASFFTSCSNQSGAVADTAPAMPGNPFLPLWEHIPDGEPYVFEDPDNPGQQRVYIYGSHDSRLTDYCGRELVVWSASVDNLMEWRYDGEIFSVNKNANGELLRPDSVADVLFAPDVTLVTAADGTKTYYLYPNNQAGGRNGMVCKSSRPDGPFEVCNWSNDNPNRTDGILEFDPAVFVDDDGKIYGYWGFNRSYAAELDPATMATVKPGTKIVEDMVSGRMQEGIFSFFEASSIRKIKDKYVFIYSRFTKDGEFGLPVSNYTLAYAYGDNPLGPWTYGGTIIDGRGREVNEQGDTIASATIDGNTHGSICEINGQWYVFYHRQSGLNEYARQAMVAPISVEVEEGKGGKVVISEGEYTSEGFALNGLAPFERHSAGIACWYTGPKPAVHTWPNNTFYGSYVAATYGEGDKFEAPYELRNNTNPVVNNTDGLIVGYKYFNFEAERMANKANLMLVLRLIPEGIDGTIEIMLDRPWESQGGKKIGETKINGSWEKADWDVAIGISKEAQDKYLAGKHAIYFVFKSDTKEKSICTLKDFVFTFDK
ncbi:MAG: family 43 glycosylhydrolase [Salinivirgaceae bacterium]|nr:family 43 glycosylhydrolase [Salinivirgaceae bacterium]